MGSQPSSNIEDYPPVAEVLEYFREQVAAGKSKLIVNGEGTLKIGDVVRVTSVAEEIEGLFWAVRESKE